MLTTTTLPLITVFLLNAGLGFLVFSSRTSVHRRVNLAFSLFAWSLSSWIFCILMIFLFTDPDSRLLWLKLGFVASSNIPSTFLYFSVIFPNEKRVPTSSTKTWIFVAGFLFSLLS